MAGEVLWTDLEDAVSATRVTAGDIFAPDYCDLREEWRKPQSEPLDELVQAHATLKKDPQKVILLSGKVIEILADAINWVDEENSSLDAYGNGVQEVALRLARAVNGEQEGER